jgi:hypothetical protein
MNTFSTPRLWTRTLTTNALISVEGLAFTLFGARVTAWAALSFVGGGR